MKALCAHRHMFMIVLDELMVIGVTNQDDEQLETFPRSVS